MNEERTKQFYQVGDEFKLVDISLPDKKATDGLVRLLRKLKVAKEIDRDKLLNVWKTIPRDNVRKFMNR